MIRTSSVFAIAMVCAISASLAFADDTGYLVCVSLERAGKVALIDGETGKVAGEIAAGKRPRGIHAGPDGRLLYVALSGSPIQGPPKLDPQGNPIFEEDDEEEADHSADGIGVVDLSKRAFVKKIFAGSDPEEFALARDGRRLFVSNEDVGTASAVDLASEKVTQIFRVGEEPEGVAVSPDGAYVYVTCETAGEVFVIDTKSGKTVGQFVVGGRPRTVAFSPDGAVAYIPSETNGVVHIVDARKFEPIDKIELPEKSRPMCVVADAEGKRLFVSCGRAGTICVIDVDKREVVGTIPAGTRPWGLGLSPDGSRLYAANGPSNDISVIDVAAGKEVARIKCDGSPWGIAIAPKRSQSSE